MICFMEINRLVQKSLMINRTTHIWIYLLPSTQQTIGCNDFYNDMFRLTRVIVRLGSETFGFSTIVTYSSGGCWSVWSGGYPYTDMNEILRHISRNFTRNCLMFIITQVPHATHTQVKIKEPHTFCHIPCGNTVYGTCPHSSTQNKFACRIHCLIFVWEHKLIKV
jgi:hypothetical protein